VEAPPSPPVLSVDRITKRFGKIPAVEDISLALWPGEAVGLIGPNGSGKTTTLRLITGLLRPDAGSVHLMGVDVHRHTQQVGSALAFIPDTPELFYYLTVLEHPLFLARLHRIPDARARAEQWIRHFGLWEKKHSFPATLSRGMKQKLALATSLITGPRVLLLDEPMVGLDPAGMRELKDIVREFVARGGAALISSHDLALVQQICARVVIVRDGHVVLSGAPEELMAATGHSGLEDVFLSVTRPPTPTT
jgi:ABC-2 type transport system ATP-binding protein